MTYISAAVVNSPAPSTDGWFDDTSTSWIYVNPTSFKLLTVDATIKFRKNTRLRLKQGGTYKYFNVVSSSFSTDTTVTITGGDDFSLANAVISDNWFSYAESPQGFPVSFNWSPVMASDNANFSIGNGTQIGTFYIAQGLVFVHAEVTWGSTTSSGTGGLYLSNLPVGSPSDAFLGTAAMYDSSAAGYFAGGCGLASSRLKAFGSGGSGPWKSDTPAIWTTGDIFTFDFHYYL